MIVHYCAGYIRTEITMPLEDYAAGWIDKAKKADANGNELVVFEVPKSGLLFDIHSGLDELIMPK